MGDEGLCYASLGELSAGIRKGEVSPVEVTEAHLGRIESLNPELFAFPINHIHLGFHAAPPLLIRLRNYIIRQSVLQQALLSYRLT